MNKSYPSIGERSSFNLVETLKKELPSILNTVPDLKENGTQYEGPCPLCGGEDRFFVTKKNPDRYFCRGCNKGGDKINLHMKLNGCSQMNELLTGINVSPPVRQKKSKQPKASSTPGNLKATYNYTDEEGVTLSSVGRYEEQGKEKTFRQWHFKDGKKVHSTQGIDRVPYNLPGIIEGDRVIIVEGEKDADRLIDLGITATCFMGSNWKPEYSQFFKGKTVTIIPDNDEPGEKFKDAVVNGLDGVTAATKVLNLAGLLSKGDVSDWLDKGNSKDELHNLIIMAKTAAVRVEIDETEGNSVTVEQLALLSPLEYDRLRKGAAKDMGVRVSILDTEVEKLREYDDTPSAFEELEPWDDEVNGNDLLNEIRTIIKNHLIMQPGVDVAISLWVLLTFCHNDFRILPLLGITSPEKRCGKTTCAEILIGLVFKAVPASNISSAVLYRIIEKYHPTMLVDEADTFLIDNDELRGVFNAGHTKKSAFVWRCNSETNEPEKFSVWGCKVVLMIGDLPDTMKDRAIPVRMRRKASGESVQKMTLDFDDTHKHIREKCLRWAEDNNLAGIEPISPNVGNDRASDNWLPLLAIADKAGGEWPDLARTAMHILETDDLSDKESVGQMLLGDIKKIFEKTGGEKISSENIVQHLNGMEDRPWCEWKRGNPITKNTVSRLLKPYGIKSKLIRFPDKPLHGYLLKTFEDSFKRYLHSRETTIQPVTALQANDSKGFIQIQNVTSNNDVMFQKRIQSNDSKGCNDVTIQSQDTVYKDKKTDTLPFEGRL